MLTLTIHEIKDLAEFAGLRVAPVSKRDLPDMDAELTVSPCPETGIQCSEGGWHPRYRYVAIYTDYPEEGCHPLGPRIREEPTVET